MIQIFKNGDFPIGILAPQEISEIPNNFDILKWLEKSSLNPR